LNDPTAVLAAPVTTISLAMGCLLSTERV